jgi:hypothetical protein
MTPIEQCVGRTIRCPEEGCDCTAGVEPPRHRPWAPGLAVPPAVGAGFPQRAWDKAQHYGGAGLLVANKNVYYITVCPRHGRTSRVAGTPVEEVTP